MTLNRERLKDYIVKGKIVEYKNCNDYGAESTMGVVEIANPDEQYGFSRIRFYTNQLPANFDVEDFPEGTLVNLVTGATGAWPCC
jgi:hypothetical protein